MTRSAPRQMGARDDDGTAAWCTSTPSHVTCTTRARRASSCTLASRRRSDPSKTSSSRRSCGPRSSSRATCRGTSRGCGSTTARRRRLPSSPSARRTRSSRLIGSQPASAPGRRGCAACACSTWRAYRTASGWATRPQPTSSRPPCSPCARSPPPSVPPRPFGQTSPRHSRHSAAPTARRWRAPRRHGLRSSARCLPTCGSPASEISARSRPA
mmetsp:Transcript_60790/g.146331  ORF Transcript_60790/g.146331 Transcript_60790/m.146331 type:complete len:213 (-) Transcript_60790:633-1271(-)